MVLNKHINNKGKRRTKNDKLSCRKRKIGGWNSKKIIKKEETRGQRSFSIRKAPLKCDKQKRWSRPRKRTCLRYSNKNPKGGGTFKTSKKGEKWGGTKNNSYQTISGT